jgi:hypothetical protein
MYAFFRYKNIHIHMEAFLVTLPIIVPNIPIPVSLLSTAVGTAPKKLTTPNNSLGQQWSLSPKQPFLGRHTL